MKLYVAWSMKKRVDKWIGWRQVQKIHIFLCVEYVRAPDFLIEVCIWKTVKAASSAAVFLRTHSLAVVSHSAGQHYSMTLKSALPAIIRRNK